MHKEIFRVFFYCLLSFSLLRKGGGGVSFYLIPWAFGLLCCVVTEKRLN